MVPLSRSHAHFLQVGISHGRIFNRGMYDISPTHLSLATHLLRERREHRKEGKVAGKFEFEGAKERWMKQEAFHWPEGTETRKMEKVEAVEL